MRQPVAPRIERVVNHLRPQTAFEGRYGAPESLHKRLARHYTPGASIAVINDFEIEWARGYGTCEAGRPADATPTTLFQAGSISKPVFALAVMYLVQESQLDLDEDINVYLRSWRVSANEGWQPRITLRQLLSHSAGLTVHGFPGYQSSEPIPTSELEFFIKGVNVKITFESHDNDNIIAMTVSQEGKQMRAERKS